VKTLSLLAICAIAACGGASSGPGPAAPDGTGSAEQINRTKCGACHAPFDPGTHTKAQLEPILKKHKDEGRARLGDEDWARLTDYLSGK
jgi:hypothetical protein